MLYVLLFLARLLLLIIGFDRNQAPEANAFPFSSPLIFLRKGTKYSRVIDSRKNFSSSLSSMDNIIKNYISRVIRRRTILRGSERSESFREKRASRTKRRSDSSPRVTFARIACNSARGRRTASSMT